MARDLRKICPELACESCSKGRRWFTRGGAPPPWIAAVDDALATGSARVFSLAAGGARLFVKRTPLRGLRRRARATWRIESTLFGGKGPILEAANSLLVERAGVPVPAVLAYGESPTRGLARESVLVFEEVRDARTLSEAMRQHAGQPTEILERAWALVDQLARQPLVHLDLHGSNILLSDLGAPGDRIIDFEICARVAGDHPEVLAFYLGNLWRRGAQGVLDAGTYNAFANAALGRVLQGEPLAHARARFPVYRARRFGFGERRRLTRRR